MDEDFAIMDALYGHLDGMPLGESGAEIFFPTIETAQPTTGKPYIAPRFLPDPTETPFIGNKSAAIFTGELRLAVHVPSSMGELEARKLAGMAVCYFKRGTRLCSSDLTVNIKHRPSQAPAITTADRITIPVSVRYFASKSYKDHLK